MGGLALVAIAAAGFFRLPPPVRRRGRFGAPQPDFRRDAGKWPTNCEPARPPLRRVGLRLAFESLQISRLYQAGARR